MTINHIIAGCLAVLWLGAVAASSFVTLSVFAMDAAGPLWVKAVMVFVGVAVVFVASTAGFLLPRIAGLGVAGLVACAGWFALWCGAEYLNVTTNARWFALQAHAAGAEARAASRTLPEVLDSLQAVDGKLKQAETLRGKALQEWLESQRADPGPLDGSYGPQTRQAHDTVTTRLESERDGLRAERDRLQADADTSSAAVMTRTTRWTVVGVIEGLVGLISFVISLLTRPARAARASEDDEAGPVSVRPHTQVRGGKVTQVGGHNRSRRGAGRRDRRKRKPTAA